MCGGGGGARRRGGKEGVKTVDKLVLSIYNHILHFEFLVPVAH